MTLFSFNSLVFLSTFLCVLYFSLLFLLYVSHSLHHDAISPHSTPPTPSNLFFSADTVLFHFPSEKGRPHKDINKTPYNKDFFIYVVFTQLAALVRLALTWF